MNILKEKRSSSSPWITLAILSSLGIIAVSAETMVLPAIPDIIHELAISYENSSWILAVLLVMGAVMTPIAGKLSDVYGKKRVLTDTFRSLYNRSFIRFTGIQFSYTCYC